MEVRKVSKVFVATQLEIGNNCKREKYYIVNHNSKRDGSSCTHCEPREDNPLVAELIRRCTRPPSNGVGDFHGWSSRFFLFCFFVGVLDWSNWRRFNCSSSVSGDISNEARTRPNGWFCEWVGQLSRFQDLNCEGVLSSLITRLSCRTLIYNVHSAFKRLWPVSK